MSNKARSYLLYFGLLLICFILADKAQKREDKRYVFVIALLLGLLMGLRNKSVGYDTKNYYYLFNSINSISAARQQNDPFFYITAYFLMKIDNTPYFPIFVFSMISNFLVIYRLWDFRDISIYKYSVLRYFTIFYFFSFNCMRQFLSIAIAFYGTKYLDSGEYIKYLIIVFVASLFHLAAIVGVVLLFFEIKKWKELDKKQKNFISLYILLIPIYVLGMFYVASGRYERYFDNISFMNFTSVAVKIVIFIAILMFFLGSREYTDDKKIRLVFLYYFIGLMLNLLGSFYQFMERLGYYFYIYATIYTGIIARYRKYILLFRILILIVLLRSFTLNCINNSMGQMPYIFKWE